MPCFTPFHATFDPELDVVVVHGTASTADAKTVRHAMTTIENGPVWSKSRKVLVDLRSMQFEVAGSSLSGVGGMIGLASFFTGRRVAVVTYPGVQAGLLGVLIKGAELQETARIYHDWPNAVEWLVA